MLPVHGVTEGNLTQGVQIGVGIAVSVAATAPETPCCQAHSVALVFGVGVQVGVKVGVSDGCAVNMSSAARAMSRNRANSLTLRSGVEISPLSALAPATRGLTR